MTMLALTTQDSLTIVAICQLIATLAVLALTVGVLWAVFSLKRLISTKVDQAMAEVKPVAEQARSIAEMAKKTADTVSEKVDAIMTTAEDGATSVGNTVRSVSKRMEDAVDPRIVNLAGLVGTILKCAQVWREVAAVRHAPACGEEYVPPEE